MSEQDYTRQHTESASPADLPAPSPWQRPTDYDDSTGPQPADSAGAAGTWLVPPPVGQPAQVLGAHPSGAYPPGAWDASPGPSFAPGGPAALAPQRKVGIPLLAAALAVFLVVSAVFIALYITEHSAHNRTQHDRQGVQQELESTTSKLNTVQQNERDQQNRIADLEHRNADLKNCADAAHAFFDALYLSLDDQSRDNKINQAIEHMFVAC